MSKILVTGGAGFVGTNLIIELYKLGHEIVSIDNYSIGIKKNHQAGVNYIEGDVNYISELIQKHHEIEQWLTKPIENDDSYEELEF